MAVVETELLFFLANQRQMGHKYETELNNHNEKVFLLITVSLFALLLAKMNLKFQLFRSQFPTRKGGSYQLPDKIVILISWEMEWYCQEYLIKKLSVAPGKQVTLDSKGSNADIVLNINKKADPVIGDEGYALSVTSSRISISANKPAGLLYGVQTLLQLLPPQIESDRPEPGIVWQIPQVEITDYPRVAWRGLMLDVARHFFTVDEVKRYLDNMVKYKYNASTGILPTTRGGLSRSRACPG